MSTNQYRGREETNKQDFKNLNPEEQRKLSRENISHEQDDVPLNEKIANSEKNKLDQEKSKHIH